MVIFPIASYCAELSGDFGSGAQEVVVVLYLVDSWVKVRDVYMFSEIGGRYTFVMDMIRNC